ncbi:uncharacterized protein PGTG_13856 [Puccinia graminis f. sp. tritici CRL 75-36-700-3]|uniref:CxC1-like cysteine cluster associated with KDZ transposases domain-containing protein n=1 Tax=Puccinia graminis f. sp. tritici (strain CRL 75-36-700-3 / race SCCL) TaxID=418459 RepID=E3KUF9_PUCGT|nr:uncharacterized protein PGTG_13856 [Puccinia graminis f. sp. tritici CRL 75-36-700-3]EFP88052.2 hypothetical protein PGTG_13856 [Puccinia graminis f. sp. tritici CRL 75-36-700-3]
MARTQTGFIQRRGPTIVRQPRSGTSGRPVDLNAAIAMALRHGLLVIDPRQNRVDDREPNMSPQDEYSADHFHQHEPPLHQDSPLPDDFITQYAMRRDRLSNAWKSIEKSITAAFFVCQYHTKNWTASTTYLEPLDESPTSSTHNKTKNTNQAIHDYCLDRFHRQEIEFCSCIPDAIRLIHLGYIPASPTTPRTAFSVPLVQLYQHLWNESAIPYTSFISGIMYHQDTRSRESMYARSRNHNPRDLRIPFSQAMDIYGRIQTLHKDLITVSLGLTTQDHWATKCPACFGPEKPDEESLPGIGEAYAIIAMDGNFQHRHHKFASTDVPTEADYPSNFIPPSEINTHEAQCQSTDQAVTELRTSCSDAHKAANDVRNSASWDKFDDTGLFGSCCRHDIPLKLNNIQHGGEKLYYPVSIIDNILKAFPTKKFGILYDIGCHLDAHVKKRDLLGNDLDRVYFGTSVFHAYVHNWDCQIKYNPRYNSNWGLSDGEGMERLWSQLSDMVGPLRNATRIHRLQAIGRQCDYYNEKLKLSISKLNSICNQTNPFSEGGENYTQDFFQQQWILERSYYQNRNNEKAQQKLELGRLLNLEEDLNAAWGNLPLTPEDTLARVNTISDIQAQIEQQRQRVGANQVVEGVSRSHETLFLKVWWAKTDLRRKYLALLEEKRPLDAVRMGTASKLGTAGKEKLINSIRKKTFALEAVVNTYNRHLSAFHIAFPNRPILQEAVYDTILQMEPDDIFWMDGVFTNNDEPWAIDPDTQDGMRLVARQQRAREETCRIGREMRRAVRWAVIEHQRIIPLMFGLATQSELVKTRLRTALTHPILQTLSTEDQLDFMKAILHNHFINLSTLQLNWNKNVEHIIFNTGPYENDTELFRDWNEQVLRLSFLKQSGNLSKVSGDFDNAIGNNLDNIDESVMRDFLAQDFDFSAAPTNQQEDDQTNIEPLTLPENMPSDSNNGQI